MKIFIRRESQEIGPFTRDEVFARLANSSLAQDEHARTEENPSWRPLMDVLKVASASSLFSVEEITAEQERLAAEAERHFSEVRPSESDGAEETREEPKPARLPTLAREILAIAAVAMMGGFGAVFLLPDSEPSPPALSVAASAPAPAPIAQSLAPAKPEPAPVQVVRQEAPPPKPASAPMVAATPSASAPLVAAVSVAPAATAPELPLLDPPPGLDPPASAAMLEPPAAVASPKSQPAATATAEPPLPQPLRPAASAPKPKTVAKPRSTPMPAAAPEPQPPVVAVTDPPPLEPPAPTTPVPKPKTAAKSTPVPKPKPIAYARQVYLPKADEIKSTSFWVADTAAEPRAALILCLDSKDKAESVAKDQTWQRFARDHQFALGVITFTSMDKLPKTSIGFRRADRGSGNLLLLGIEYAFGKRLPMVLYGRGGAGVFAGTFANWRPDRLLLWTAYANDWRDAPRDDKSSAPGIVACDLESARSSNLSIEYFAAGRRLGKRWTWLCLGAPWKERQKQLDDFFRDYARTYFAGGAAPEVWADVRERRPMSALDFMVRASEAAWLPSASLTPAWAALVARKDAVPPAKIVQRSVATRSARQPEIEFFLRLPATLPPDQKIKGTLAFCTWEKDPASIIKKLEYRIDDKSVELPGPAAEVARLIRYAEKHHFALLTWGTSNVWSVTSNSGELAKKAEQDFDRNFDSLATAWERGLELLHQEFEIPATDLLLYGISRGAQWSHRLALRKPHRFLGVHVHIPSSFDVPVAAGNQVVWLVTTGELESGYERAKSFYGQCRALGYPIIFKAIIGIGHSGSPVANELGLLFFDYALALQAQRRTGQPGGQSSALAALKKDTRHAWLRPFREPPFVGDLVNQEVFPLNQVEMVPAGFRVPLPTQELATAWNK